MSQLDNLSSIYILGMESHSTILLIFGFSVYSLPRTVLLPSTFVYPVSGRFDESIHDDEERQFIVSSDGSFSQEDLLRHFEQISQEEFGGRPVPVRSCFGGLAIYKSEVWHEPKCRYSSWQDQCSPDAVRYANIEDGRACEHVTFHACLREHRKGLAVAVQPKLMPMWDSAAQSLSSSLRSGEHLLTVHSDTNGDNGSQGGGNFNSTESGHQFDHDHLSSSDVRYRMRIHPVTGNVLLEEMGATSAGDNKIIWSALDNSNTTSLISTANTPYTEWMNMRHAIQSVLVLRDDGKLVLEREVHNTAQQICNPLDMACRFEVWSSTTSAIGDGNGSNKNAFLHLSDQGTLTLQDRDSGELLWSATQEDTWSECPSYIPSGFQLHEGDILCSPGDTYRSGIDSNGFFVLRNDATTKNEKAYIPLTGLDEIASDSSSSTMTAHIQGDGNLVIHSLSNDGEDRDIVLWSSNSAFPGSEGSRVALHDDGILRIVTRKGIVLRELIPKGPSPACPTILPSGGRLEAGEHLCSHSAVAPSSNVPMYKFGLSSSGIPVLVVTKEVEQSQVVWVASVNVTSTSTSLTLQDDGNLVLYDESSVALWSSSTAAFGAVVSFSTDGGLQMITPDGSVVALLSETSGEFERPPTERVILESNDALTPGEIICSPSGNFCFGLDADKDQLCLWKVAGGDNSASSTSLTPDKDCIWSKTFQDIDEFSASSLIMQGDGNLVLVADGGSDRTLHWSSESHGSANEDSYIVIRDYGAAEIVNKQGITTFSIAGSDVCPRWLLGGQSLRNDGEFVCSADSRYRLGLGSDSSLAIYDLRSQEKVWETSTCCDDVSAFLQADANFIVRGSFDDLWSTDATTNATSGVALRLSDNGDAEILDMDGSLVWSSAAAKDDNKRTLRAASPLPGCDAVNFRPEDDDFRTFALPKRSTKHHRIVFMSESFASTKRNRVLSHRWDFGDAPQIHHKTIKAQDNVPSASLGDDTNITEQCEYDDWQSRSYLACNSVHESTAFRETTTFLGQGANNQGWAMSSSTSSPGVTDEFVLKRQVVHNTFSPKYYERARLESLVMQRMTSSRRILDTYGYCGTSIMNQKGWREMSSLGIEQQTISPKQMLQYGLGVSQALADLHEGGILHTDLSASNVLIGPKMEVILHDFDQAALLTHGEGSRSSCGVRMHDEKCDHYRSPEKCHFDNQVLTTKSDVYGLGGLLYFLLSGATPYSFPEIDDLEVVRSKIRRGTLPQYPLHIELSKSKSITALKEIAHQFLRYEPENRPEAREVAKLIEAALLNYDEEEEKESSNEILAPGSVLDGKSSHLQSSNSSHTFGFDHASGDLSIWHNDKIIWSLGLCCQGDEKLATFNFDGNFVVEGKGDVIYDTGTDYGGQWVGAVMFVDNDGKVKLKNYHGYETILFDPYSRFLRRGDMLNQTSERLNSAESNHTFGFDLATGDLSIWHNDQIIWSLGLCCQGDDKFATFTSDGNFVVEDRGGVIYDTGTDYGGQWVGAIMFVDNDGNVKLKNNLGQETIVFGPSESNAGTSNFKELSSEPWFPPAIVDSSTMHGRVFTGYQGWFTTPCDDGLKRWHHWSDRSTPDNETLTIDMWPDLDEYDDDELCETDLLYGDGTKASVFSSYNPRTVDRHIRWMSEYGIDGPFVQRFVTDIKVFRHMRDHVLKLVQASSERYGRVFSNMYDLTGAEKGIQTLEDIKRDWKFLVDGLKVTESSRYLNHKGRPVLGLFFGKPSKSPLSANEALELIDWLQNHDEERYRVTVIVGGLEKSWRSDPDEQWMPVFNQADVISPWTIGRYFDQESVDHHGKRYLIPDVNHCHENDQDYLPVVFPGFSAKNIMPGKPLNEIPRNGGQFLWRQLLHASRSKANMIFVAMFDEVDEGTAIFKTASTASRAPSNTNFVTLDIDKDTSHEMNLPSDFYLQLVGEAKRLLSEGAEFPYTYEYLSRPQGDDNATSKDNNGWNDVYNLSDPSDMAPCGAHKCFFLSASNPNRTGYLVQQGDPFRRSENLQSQYESTVYLESKYGTRHFLLGPPASVDVPDSLVSQLNKQVDRRHKYSALEPIVVQKVKVAPRQSMMMLGCHLDRQPQIREDIQNFLETNIDNITEFSLQFERELSSIIQVMEKEPWYARDWQAMVDRHGHLYSIDIAPRLSSTDGKGDKMGYTTLDWIDLCYEMFQDFVKVATERGAHHPEGELIAAAARNTSFHSFRGGKDFDLLALDPTNDCAAGACTVASADNPYIGYEVTSTESPKLTESWEVARTLTNKYLIHHDVLGRPVPVNTTFEAASDAAVLLANIQAHPGEGTVLVQKVLRKHPLDSFSFSCDPSVQGGDQLEKERLGNFVQDSVADRTKFLKRLTRSDSREIERPVFDCFRGD